MATPTSENPYALAMVVLLHSSIVALIIGIWWVVALLDFIGALTAFSFGMRWRNEHFGGSGRPGDLQEGNP